MMKEIRIMRDVRSHDDMNEQLEITRRNTGYYKHQQQEQLAELEAEIARLKKKKL